MYRYLMKDDFMVTYLKTNILAKIEFVIKLHMSFQAYFENIQAKTGIRFRPRTLYDDLSFI